MTPITDASAGSSRLRLDLAYLGTRFEGWQVQPERAGHPPRTVQGALEEALARVYGGRVTAQAAGRTDAGVHARRQVVHLAPPAVPAIPPEGLRRALNRLLPEDVRVLAATLVPATFHARFSAAGKRYVYRLRRGDILSPFEGQVEALTPYALDVDAMRQAARALEGRRDFGPFSITGGAARSTVRTLARLAIEEDGPLLTIVALGDGFLRGMVRRLVGTLVDAGRGRIDPDEAGGRPGPTAPARGLTLDDVFYPAPFQEEDRISGSARLAARPR